MPPAISTAAPAMAATARINGRRALLVLGTLAAVALTLGDASPAAADADHDLVRLLQFMAALKGGFAVVALAACYWRLARPATAWRDVVYVAGPALMTAGAIGLWRLQSAGLAAILLHAGMFGLLAAGLTDAAFLPASRRRGA